MNKLLNVWRMITVAALLAGTLNLSFLPAKPAYAISTNVVISQVYGGGGNSGATYRNDYIELFNRGAVAVDLSGWSVQYSSPTGTGAWSAKTALSGTLQPGQYFLVQESAGSGGTNSLPTPDIIGTIALAATAGKVALVSNTTLLGSSCPSGVIDLVGYGSSANCSEAGPTAAPGNTTAVKRNMNGCSETDNNNADFSVADPAASPTPRNSASPLNPCVVIPSLTVSDVSVVEGNSGTSTAMFTVSLSTPAALGGVTFDIATADGSAATANNDYVGRSLSGQTIPAGSSSFVFDVTVNGDTSIESDEDFYVNVTNVSGATVSDGQGTGTITNDDNATPQLSIDDITVNEGDSGSSTASFTVSLNIPALAGGVTFDIATADNTATTADNDYVPRNLTSQTIAAGSTIYTFDVTINGDTTAESDEAFFVNVTSVTGAAVTDGQGVGTISNDEAVITPIYTIQGSGPSTALSGTYTTQGVVVADYEGGASPEMRGFYIQDAVGDGNPATSDGLFVFNSGNNSVALGDFVRVTGIVSETQGQTQISAANVIVLSTGNSLAPTDISLPFASAAVEEQYEGMLVRVPQTLYVTEHYLLGRFGEVTLSATDRLYQPTHVTDPGASALALQAANDLNRIILDDASQSQNVDPIVFGRGGNPLSAANTLRGGDTVSGLVGVFTYSWGGNSASPTAYRIRPINALGGGIPNFVAANPRPSTPPIVGGTIKAVGMNLLNYFNTFGTGACTNGVGGASIDCRGANDSTEFTRQSDKTVHAILALDADVVGIMEIENDGYGSVSAIQDLVNRLNVAAGAGTYAFIDPDLANGTNSLGTNAIKVGILYKPARLTPVGTTAVLNTAAFINGGDSAPRNRASLLQAFQTASGERFLINVNHLKSKGNACDAPDAGDGQGECNAVRTNAVEDLLAWFATNPTGTGDPDILIVGDLNSYAHEDPIKKFKVAGYTDLVSTFGGANAYSYAYDGQWGYLDYAIASPSLLSQVTGSADWHINADEPAVLDYNTEFKTAGQIISLYSSTPFRISDHDPVVTGMDLNANVGKVILTVTASSAGITYGSSAPTIVPAYLGFTNGDDASVLDSAPTCTVSGPFTVAGSPYVTSCFGGLDNKYAFNYVNGKLTVSTKPLSITASNGIKTYGVTRTFTGTEFASLGLVNNDVISSVTLISAGSVNTANVGSYGIVPAAAVGSGLSNYTVTYYNGALTVIKATLTVTATDRTMTFGSSDPTFTFGYGGFANNETGSVIDIAPTCGVTGAHGTPGMYPIICSGGVDNNYDFTFVNGTLTVSGITTATFVDVPLNYWAWRQVESVHAFGISGGCGNNPLIYCPTAPVTRDQMAIFILKGLHGGSYVPPPVGASTGFGDVPVNYWAAAWIKELTAEGITGVCGNNMYCPTMVVTRDKMAVFLLRAEHGSAYIPPSVGLNTGFKDVLPNHWAAAWIKQLAIEGVTVGCGNGNYCPNTPVTRDQVAVFLARIFTLPLP